MTPPLSPLPASLSHPETDADLDERIRQVEQRLIAREENLRRGMTALGGQVQARLQPRRLLMPALVALGGLLLLKLWRRPAAPAPRPAARAAARPALLALLAGLPWMRLFDLAWPLVQRRLQARRREAADAGPR